MTNIGKVAGGFLALGIMGCATNFTGSPHVEGGRAGCEKKCSSNGMEVSGMVYMGEYSSACVCAVPGQSAKGGEVLLGSTGAVSGAAAGVAMQQQRSQRSSSQ